MKKIALSILLSLLAIVLFALLAPIGSLWGVVAILWSRDKDKVIQKTSEYFMSIAISIDQLGNVWCAELFDDILRKPKGEKFGDPDETISSVLGKNKADKSLSLIGRQLSKLLNWLDPNHVEKAIEK